MKKLNKIFFWLLIIVSAISFPGYKTACSCADFLLPEATFNFQVNNRSKDVITCWIFSDQLGLFKPGQLATFNKTYDAEHYPSVADYKLDAYFTARNERTGKLSKAKKILLTTRKIELIEFSDNDF
ncbi:MAG: hypothetical protein WC621_03750 [Patescibacteria group bacterium]